MQSKLVQRGAFSVIGLQIRSTPMSAEIPALWPRFVARIAEIPGQTEVGASYGLMQYQRADASLDYMAAVAVEEGSAAPDGMQQLRLAAADYLVFAAPFAEIAAAFCAVFERHLPASGYEQADGLYFERYAEDFDPDAPDAQFEIWIPVRPRA